MPAYELVVAEDAYSLTVSQSRTEWSAGEYVEMHIADLPEYDGPTTVVPSGSAQVLATAGRAVLTDITIDPIPSNYGLITWDGHTILVS